MDRIHLALGQNINKKTIFITHAPVKYSVKIRAINSKSKLTVDIKSYSRFKFCSLWHCSVPNLTSKNGPIVVLSRG